MTAPVGNAPANWPSGYVEPTDIFQNVPRGTTTLSTAERGRIQSWMNYMSEAATPAINYTLWNYLTPWTKDTKGTDYSKQIPHGSQLTSMTDAQLVDSFYTVVDAVTGGSIKAEPKDNIQTLPSPSDIGGEIISFLKSAGIRVAEFAVGGVLLAIGLNAILKGATGTSAVGHARKVTRFAPGPVGRL